MWFHIIALQPFVPFARAVGVVLAVVGILLAIISRMRTNRYQLRQRDEALRHSACLAQVTLRELLAARGRSGSPSSSKSVPAPQLSTILSRLPERDATLLQRDLGRLYQTLGHLANCEHFGQLQGLLECDYRLWADVIREDIDSVLDGIPVFKDVDDWRCTSEARSLITELAQAVIPLPAELTSLAEFVSGSLLGFFFTL